MAFGKYLNPANAVTASRYLSLPPFLYWLDRGDIHYATLALLFSAMMDLFDGPVARLCKCSSGFGEMFDAVTDGLCYGFALICLSAYGFVPWIPIAAVMVLGVFNSVLRAMYSRRVGRTTNFRSFAMEQLVGYTSALTGVGIARFETDLLAWPLPFVMLVVIIWDFKRMLIDPVPA